MEGVEASSVTEAREFQFSLDRLVFEHRLLPLLSGTVAIDRIVLERPQFELVESEVEREQASSESRSEPESGEEAPAGEAGADEGGLALDVRQIVVSDGTVVLRKKGEDGETRIEGLDFEMNDLTIDPTKESLAAIGAEGELGVVRILADTIEIREAASQFRLADAIFEMPELSFVTDHGRFKADMQVDFNPVPFTYTMSASGDPLDVNGIVGASEGFGPGLVQLEASGEGAETKDVDGDGGLQLGEGQFPDVAMFSGIDKALGKQVVEGSSYRATEAKFHLANNVVTLAPFRFETDSLRLDLEGTLSLEGPLQFQLVAATPAGERYDGGPEGPSGRQSFDGAGGSGRETRSEKGRNRGRNGRPQGPSWGSQEELKKNSNAKVPRRGVAKREARDQLPVATGFG